MKNQLKGIALILFGIICMMFSVVNPWIPIFDSLLGELAPFLGLASGIAGVIYAFKNEE